MLNSPKKIILLLSLLGLTTIIYADPVSMQLELATPNLTTVQVTNVSSFSTSGLHLVKIANPAIDSTITATTVETPAYAPAATFKVIFNLERKKCEIIGLDKKVWKTQMCVFKYPTSPNKYLWIRVGPERPLSF